MNRYRWLMLFLGLALVRGLVYAAVIPPWQSPDETGHFEYIWLITHLGRLPDQGDVSIFFERELLGSLYEWRYDEYVGPPLPERMPAWMGDLPPNIYAGQSRTIQMERFSLTYLWSAIFLLPFRCQDLLLQVYVVRLSSVLLNLAIVWLALWTFLELIPSRPTLAFLMTSVVVFLPQHTFINSMVGDGVLAELMACLVLYCWVRLFRHGLTIWEIVGLILGTYAAIWSKTTVAFLIPVSIGLAIWWLVRRYRQSRFNRRYLIYLCASVVLFGIGIWLWSRFSPLGAQTVESVYSFRQALSSPSGLLWMDARGLTIGEALLITYDSFWANFGWMALAVGGRWYGAIVVFSIMSLIGWMLGKTNDVPVWAVGMTSGIVCVALATFTWVALLSQPGYYQFQGRYLFPVLVPYAFLLVGGLERLIPALGRRSGMALFLLCLVGFDTWCLVGYILPYFVSR